MALLGSGGGEGGVGEGVGVGQGLKEPEARGQEARVDVGQLSADGGAEDGAAVARVARGQDGPLEADADFGQVGLQAGGERGVRVEGRISGVDLDDLGGDAIGEGEVARGLAEALVGGGAGDGAKVGGDVIAGKAAGGDAGVFGAADDADDVGAVGENGGGNGRAGQGSIGRRRCCR